MSQQAMRSLSDPFPFLSDKLARPKERARHGSTVSVLADSQSRYEVLRVPNIKAV